MNAKDMWSVAKPFAVPALKYGLVAAVGYFGIGKVTGAREIVASHRIEQDSVKLARSFAAACPAPVERIIYFPASALEPPKPVVVTRYVTRPAPHPVSVNQTVTVMPAAPAPVLPPVVVEKRVTDTLSIILAPDTVVVRRNVLNRTGMVLSAVGGGIVGFFIGRNNPPRRGGPMLPPIDTHDKDRDHDRHKP